MKAAPCVESVAAAPGGVLRIALVGTPNSGKSTLFHWLTGARSKVANFPGVTVETVEGRLRSRFRSRLSGRFTDLVLIDLPGIYTLEPLSPDEQIASRALTEGVAGQAPPDAVVVVVDATTLRRSLPLVAEVIELGKPTFLVLTMMDEVKARGGSVEPSVISRELGIPVVGIVGNRGVGIDSVVHSLGDVESWSRARISPGVSVEERFAWADRIVKERVQEPRVRDAATDRLDRIVLHRIAGPVIFLVFMFFFFQAMFFWTAPAMDAIEALVGIMGETVSGWLPAGFIQSLVVDGIIAGVGGVVVFVPQIALVLLLLNLLEGFGYLARAAFAIDRMMGWMGLEGRCFVSLLSSYACSIPGILAARAVPDPKSRLATILVSPFMTCSARLPVYTLLIVGFVPDRQLIGLVNLRGVVFFALYLLGAVSAVVAAAVLKKIFLRGPTLPFVMELPPYRVPRISVILRQTWWGLRSFLKKAGTVILTASVVLWGLLSFPTPEFPETVRGDAVKERAFTIENSYAASVGKFVEPAIAPLGFDWKIAVGLVGSLAAREVVVATLAQIYAAPDGGADTSDLAARMAAERDPRSGRPVYQLATVLSLLVFFVYALQCVSTLAVIRRETNSFKWPLYAFTFMFSLAYVASLITYQVGSRIL